jgi:hypothetical protein
MPVFKKLGYTPKKGERQVGYITPGFETGLDLTGKKIAKKSMQLEKQGKVGLGLRFSSRGSYHKMGKSTVGIPIGKKWTFFELVNGEPAVMGRITKASGFEIVESTFEGTARARADFNKLGETERQNILRRVKAELVKKEGKMSKEEREDYKSQEKKFRDKKPSKRLYENARNNLKYSKSAMELDVIWEEYSKKQSAKTVA